MFFIAPNGVEVDLNFIPYHSIAHGYYSARCVPDRDAAQIVKELKKIYPREKIDGRHVLSNSYSHIIIEFKDEANEADFLMTQEHRQIFPYLYGTYTIAN